MFGSRFERAAMFGGWKRLHQRTELQVLRPDGLGIEFAFGRVPDHLGPLLALGVLATAIPTVFFMRLIRGAGPTRAAMVVYLQPVWATVLAILFLGEHVSLREVLGAVVVLAGVAIVSFTGGVER